MKWPWRRGPAQLPEPAAPGIRGDRGRSWVSQIPSSQSRVANLLAFGLMLALGAGLLAWYYTHAALRPGRARDTARNTLDRSAQSEMTLPPLEHLAALPRARLVEVEVAPVQTQPVTVPVPANPGGAQAAGITGPAPRSARPDRSSATHSGIERRLSGPVYAVQAAAGAADPGAGVPATDAGAVPIRVQDPPAVHATASGDPPFSALLHVEPAATGRASVLPAQRLLLPRGAFIDCTLETAIDSTLPGMTTCVTATDTFGVDGKVVLLERGTKLVGETRGQVQQGSARVFVIWTQARTPTGVVVPLESPGTDELGRSGLAGEVDRHFWDRFGAAILISTIDGAVQAAVEAGVHNGGTTIINPASVQDVATETLKSTLNIPPTVLKHNGDRIQILVARDIDFSGVYELRALPDAR